MVANVFVDFIEGLGTGAWYGLIAAVLYALWFLKKRIDELESNKRVETKPIESPDFTSFPPDSSSRDS